MWFTRRLREENYQTFGRIYAKIKGIKLAQVEFDFSSENIKDGIEKTFV